MKPDDWARLRGGKKGPKDRPGYPQTEGTVPPLGRVSDMWRRLEAANRVRGTSGWMCLTNAGSAYDKPVAVVELEPRTEKSRFVGIGWPEGRHQPEDCRVPSDTR
ncbi:hypothetical protein [Streptomyces sp. NPDC018584]|uniref:hypothetical protein n=1 Tax=unclassified Streptomyces TaxID=2593676 RepID=UPI0037A446AC